MKTINLNTLLVLLLCMAFSMQSNAQNVVCGSDYLPSVGGSTIGVIGNPSTGIIGDISVGTIGISSTGGRTPTTLIASPFTGLTGGPSTVPIEIPVVFHVVYNNAAENISDSDIIDVLAHLNSDFALQNTEAIAGIQSQFTSIAADTEIEFCLASRTPSGGATNGITRTFTNEQEFTASSSSKIYRNTDGGRDAWDPTKYLNIWICDLAPAPNGNIYGGYVLPPNTYANTYRDGVVLAYDVVFGNLVNAYSIASHEVGHYLNLLHIYGDPNGCNVDDGVTDTPLQYGPSPSGCSATSSCSSGQDINTNFMDQNINCINMFTEGQNTRMRNFISGTRSTLLSSDGCDCPTTVAAAITPTHLVTGEFFYELELWTSVPAVSATWSAPAEVFLSGNTGITIVAEVFTEEAFPITVTFTLENGCSYTRTISVNFTLPDTGGTGGGARLYHGWNDGTIFEVYPNPALDYINILTNKEIDVQLYDVAGRLIYQAQQPNGIDVSNYEKGMYFIKTKIDGEEIIKKIIIR